MAAIIDSYDESNYANTGQSLGGSPFDSTMGQSFTGNGLAIGQTKFYVHKIGSPTGDVVAKIFAHSGTFGTSSFPTGAALATSDVVDASTVVSTSGLSPEFITFNFTGINQIVLANGTNYCLQIEYGGVDRLIVGLDNTSSSHAGNLYTSSPIAANDFVFYVYAVEASSIPGRFNLLGIG